MRPSEPLAARQLNPPWLPAIAMMDKTAVTIGASLVKCLLQRIRIEARLGRPCGCFADNPILLAQFSALAFKQLDPPGSDQVHVLGMEGAEINFWRRARVWSQLRSSDPYGFSNAEASQANQ